MSITVDKLLSGHAATAGLATEEIRRPWRHPISRWYACGIADRFATLLCDTPVRPIHLTICGLLLTFCAAGILVFLPTATLIAGMLVLTAWLFDRADGQLARRQNTMSDFGAWLDANIDELCDILIHMAVAFAAARLSNSTWPWVWLFAFVAGKYLLVAGLNFEGSSQKAATEAEQSMAGDGNFGWLKRLYHLPGNADVRLHLLAAGLLTGYLTLELALIAVYYNFRWMARYVLVARRLGGAQ